MDTLITTDIITKSGRFRIFHMRETSDNPELYLHYLTLVADEQSTGQYFFELTDTEGFMSAVEKRRGYRLPYSFGHKTYKDALKAAEEWEAFHSSSTQSQKG